MENRMTPLCDGRTARCLDRLLVRLNRQIELLRQPESFWMRFRCKLKVAGNGASLQANDANNLFLVQGAIERIRDLLEEGNDSEGLRLLDEVSGR
mgnify:CR=1 FL=1